MGVEIMNESGMVAQPVEAPFTMTGDMRDAKATGPWLSKHKLTSSLACGENTVITLGEMHRDVRFSRRGDFEKKGLKA
ncbi:MAG: hypothetical protein M3Y43_07420 [Pseudomonadota bacterium]|nr:hypothetical protein [Pseudomonadota bacterium]MDQ2704977.1 hypothetical protein [Pseudomonadota bacterium]